MCQSQKEEIVKKYLFLVSVVLFVNKVIQQTSDGWQSTPWAINIVLPLLLVVTWLINCRFLHFLCCFISHVATVFDFISTLYQLTGETEDFKNNELQSYKFTA